MTVIMRAQGLGKRYGRRWALSDCTMEVPTGRVVGLVGPNGAGKSTLLNLAAGMLRPTAGAIEVCGRRPASGMAEVGYVAQDTPVYARLSVADHLRLGARLNPGWDAAVARERVTRLGLWIAVLATPPLIGMFWGAPLISAELTAGTHRLVWNQTVSRTRWPAVKLIVCGAAAMAATGLLTLAVSWWSSPIDKALDATATSAAPAGFWFPRMAEETFAARGVAPVGYAALAFMLGVTLGLLLRRLLPAMALTGVGYIAVQVVMNLWVRPALLAPEHLVMRITNTVNFSSRNGLILSQVPEPGAWITREQLTDNARHPVALPSWTPTCFTDGPGRDSQACFARLHRLYEVVVSYQPAGRFWTLQLYELGIYLALAVALAAFCVYWIRARVS